MARAVNVRLFWHVVKEVARKFYAANGAFLASGLAFDLLLYCVPLSLLLVSALGYTLYGSDQALVEVQAVLQQLLPRSHRAFTENLAAVAANRGLLGLVGFVLLFVLSSATFGSARIVLNTVFEVRHPRSFWKGKVRDFLMMLIASGLLILTVALGSMLALIRSVGERLPFLGPLMKPGWVLASALLTFTLTVALFYVLYRFSPAQTIGRRALAGASLTGAGLFELSKWLFPWVVVVMQAGTGLISALGGLLLFLVWLYYASVVFVLSATLGRVLDQRTLPTL
jgi:membrane protein